MKDTHWLVLSDTHGKTDRIAKLLAVYKDAIDGVLFLGDHARDAARFVPLYPTVPFHITVGNCDAYSEDWDERVVTLAGQKIFLTHGHPHHVKTDLLRLSLYTRELGVAACLFGHTHVAYAGYADGIYYFNPGALGESDVRRATYGMLHIRSDGVFAGTIKAISAL